MDFSHVLNKIFDPLNLFGFDTSAEDEAKANPYKPTDNSTMLDSIDLNIVYAIVGIFLVYYFFIRKKKK